jgi:hypothetical protein
LYKQRNVVERCFNRLKQFRGLATRYAKRAAYYQTELTIAAIVTYPPSTGHVRAGQLDARGRADGGRQCRHGAERECGQADQDTTSA